MIVFKVVNCASIWILIFLLFCQKYSIVEAKENVKVIETYDQEELQGIDSPTFIDIWEHVLKDKETNQPEKSRTLGDENGATNSVQNNKRFSRQTNNGYSSLYPVLTTPYPGVQFNPTPYRQPGGQQYRASQYTSNFNSYPVHQSYGTNSTIYNRQTFQNATSNYPPYNSVSFRPAPGQNVFYGNASNFNTAQRPYNQSKPHYPNTSVTPQTSWSSRPNNFNYNKQITNQTTRNPNYNPLGNLILNGYGSNYTNHNSNPTTGRAYYSQNTTPVAPWFNRTTSRNPVNNGNYPFNNQFNQRINNTINQYQHNGSRLNYPFYNTPNTVRNNTNIGPYQWTTTNSYNTTRFNIPNIPQRGSWSNSSLPRNPIYNQNNSFNRGNQNQWPYNQSHDNSGNVDRNPYYNNGPRSSMANYPVNNSSYSHQLPYGPSNYPSKTDFQNSTRYNNSPHQNNYMEPNHFFYTPGYNISSYDHRKDSAQKFSYA